jgi:selenocysteine-specific elongation factor
MSTVPRRSITVGTAGHVDHGKTALIQALTGIDCDRLPEEKRRGMTLDLGFAHLHTCGERIGFVDVPGHEDFLPNALAGLAALDALLLVVAANEGVRPQTREHLAIAGWLRLPRVLVALTKVDLVSPEMAALARLEVEELLERSPYSGSPIFPVSSRTGSGLAELTQALVELARAATCSPTDRPVRLPIDRAFLLQGKGQIVTGTLMSGSVVPGMELELQPGGQRIRIREVQVHGQEVPAAVAGERTALRLGGSTGTKLQRGQELVSPGALVPSRRFLVDLQWNPSVPLPVGLQLVEVYLASSWAPARLLPIEVPLEAPGSFLAELRLARPLLGTRGNSLIVRRASPPLTLGGGIVLDPRYRRPLQPGRMEALLGLRGSLEEALAAWVVRAGPRGLTCAELNPRLLFGKEELLAVLKRLEEAGKVVVYRPRGTEFEATRIFLAASLRALADLSRLRLPTLFGECPSSGLPKMEVARKLLPRTAMPLAAFHLNWMQQMGLLRLDGDRVFPPGAKSEPELSPLAREILERVETRGLQAVTAQELARELAAPPQMVAGVAARLVERRLLLRLPQGLFAHPNTFHKLAEELSSTGWEEFTVGEFKERFGLSRKLAIPWLEQLDNAGVTARFGDRRRLLARGFRTVHKSEDKTPNP